VIYSGTNWSAAPNNMGECIEFSAKHNIKPHLTFFKLEELPRMMDLMVSCVEKRFARLVNNWQHEGKTQGRLAVKFD